nr:flavodoxin family protein [Prevotella sp.]
MKVLVINGSPRKNGNIAKMLHSVADNINNAEIHWYDVNDLHIHPCMGCMRCRSTRECVLPKDDATMISEEINECDALLIGSPVYWGNISGQMKLLFDRIVAVMMEEPQNGFPIPLQKGKKAVIVTSCSTIWPFSWICKETTGALHAMKEILGYSGYNIVGKLVLPGTRKKKGIPKSILNKGERLAKKFK